MTKSQEKELKYHQGFKSYKSHRMIDKDLIIECETETKDKLIHYWIRVGRWGGKIVSQYVNGKWITH